MKEMPTDKTRPVNVLVVDDEPANVLLLSDMLELEGYEAKSAYSGNEGLQIASETPLSLVLLDIMMPRMDGFEMCRQLKSDPKTASIPVVFLTSLTDVESKIRAFEAGGVDFISKPFQKEEVLLRVRTQLDLYLQRMKLGEYAENLEEMVEDRTRMLIHSDRLVTLGTMAARIIHEINNPLSATVGHLQLLIDAWKEIYPLVEKHAGEDDSGKTARVSSHFSSSLSDALDGAERIRDIVNEMRKYARREGDANRHEKSLLAIVENALRIIRPRIKHGFKTSVDIPEGLKLTCDSQKIEQVFINLVTNSADAAEQGEISIRAFLKDGEIILEYRDNGPGIPEKIRGKIFQPFFTTKNAERGTGLGMMIIEEILKEHGGEIDLLPSEENGVFFRMKLDPAGKPKKNDENSG